MGSEHTGIVELFKPKGGVIDIDIVAVHGLQGDAIRTWTHEKSQICWLRDLLPRKIPNARVLSWGYLANTNSWGGKSTTSDRILHHAETLIEELQINREVDDGSTRPIIFLCHSLGGIIVKRALTIAAGHVSHRSARLHLIYTCTFGILFFGTPHNGSGIARPANRLIKFVSAVVPRRITRFETSLVTGLEVDSETLQNITQDFAPMMTRYHIYFFWEQLPTNLIYSTDYVVARSSAAPVIDGTNRCGIAANHRDMCKFEGIDSPGFKVTIRALERYVQAAPRVVETRLEESANMLGERRKNEALDLIKDCKIPLFSGQETSKHQ